MAPAANTPPAEGPQSPVAEGDVLAGKYRVDRVIGVGGMGVVVAATHIGLSQRVALKFLLPSAMHLPETKERFIREARAAVRLKSEHIAKVLDVGTLDDGAPFMVMEFLEGATLGDLVRRNGALPVADAVSFVMQACEAVAEAHVAGIVHRDLKPDNLFLTSGVDGKPLVKVLDFGIAKTASIDGRLSLTRTSTIVGSPLYMPPEQLRSAKQVDARSDIWSMGAVLFQLLVGQVPFPAESFAELCIRATQDPTPLPSASRPEVPPSLDAVVVRCLEKDPAHRFQNVGDLARALQPFAPAGSHDFADRVASVLAVGSWPRMPIGAGASPSASGALKAATGSAWGKTSGGATVRRRLTWVGAGVGLCVALALTAFVVHRGSSAPKTLAGAAPPTYVPPAPPPAPEPVVSLAPVPPALPSTSPVASAPASVAPASKLDPSTAVRARAAGTPPAQGPSPRASASASASRPAATPEGDIVFQRK